jgi:membrane protein YdbS with pleckstrin-like domain
MRYADTLLSDGEAIVLRSRQHWLAIFLDARAAILLWIIAIALIVATAALNLQGQNAQLVGGAALICIVIGLVIFAWRYWQWWAQDYIVTNRRLMKVTGIFNKRSSDSSLEKINDAVLDQNVIGRLLNYGDLDILTASGESAVDYFRMLNRAKEFKRVMLNQKHGLEMEYQGVRPSPPMRSAPVNMNGEPAARPSPPPPAVSASERAPEPKRDQRMPDEPTADERTPSERLADQPAPMGHPARSGAPADERSDASLEITQTLARLADLRDSGAISEEEYAAKKADLLGRL